MRLSEFLESVYLPSRDMGDSSAYQIRLALRKFLEWADRPVEIADLSDELICAYLRHLADEGYARTTINSRRSKLLALVRCAWRKRLVDEVPRDVPRLREARPHPVAWTMEEVARLVRECQAVSGKVNGAPACSWYSSLVLAIWDTALRIGDALRIRTRDVSLEDRCLVVRGEANRKEGGDRWCAISDATVKALAQIIKPRRKLVWDWPHHRHHLWVHFAHIVHSAGLEHDRSGRGLFYRLRRSSISYLAADSLELARRQAGHTRPETTRRHYVDPRIAERERTCDHLPALDLDGPPDWCI